MIVTRLIISADDYGYFPWVTDGILQAADAGIVTATGVIANGPYFALAAGKLADFPELDVGVHLNATLGRPRTRLPAPLVDGHGGFRGKLALAAAASASRRMRAALVAEWRAQIEACLAAGLKVRFLNSHEHVHMVPALLPAAQHLAAEFGFAGLRFSAPAWRAAGLAGAVRIAALRLLSAGTRAPAGSAELLGVAESGRLDLSSLVRLCSALERGRLYELMCHPGHAPGTSDVPVRSRRYHDWDRELRALLDPAFRDALRNLSITLVRYRDLQESAPL